MYKELSDWICIKSRISYLQPVRRASFPLPLFDSSYAPSSWTPSLSLSPQRDPIFEFDTRIFRPAPKTELDLPPALLTGTNRPYLPNSLVLARHTGAKLIFLAAHSQLRPPIYILQKGLSVPVYPFITGFTDPIITYVQVNVLTSLR